MLYIKVLAYCDYKLIIRKKKWVVLKDCQLQLASFNNKFDAKNYLQNYLDNLGFILDYNILVCGHVYSYYEDMFGKRIKVNYRGLHPIMHPQLNSSGIMDNCYLKK